MKFGWIRIILLSLIISFSSAIAAAPFTFPPLPSNEGPLLITVDLDALSIEVKLDDGCVYSSVNVAVNWDLASITSFLSEIASGKAIVVTYSNDTELQVRVEPIVNVQVKLEPNSCPAPLPTKSATIFCSQKGSCAGESAGITKTFVSESCDGVLPDNTYIGVIKKLTTTNGIKTFGVLDASDTLAPGVSWFQNGTCTGGYTMDVLYIKHPHN